MNHLSTIFIFILIFISGQTGINIVLSVLIDLPSMLKPLSSSSALPSLLKPLSASSDVLSLLKPASSSPSEEPYCFVAPRICPNKDIRFFLYTSAHPTKPVELSVSDPKSIRNAKFDRGPIKILIHGYTGNKDYTPNSQIRPAYFQKPRKINVISIDYGPLVRDGCYLQAVQNTELVGNCTAQFIERLLKIRLDIDLSQIHVIGLSLGAQVAGQIAQFLRIGLLERITGLDAALPLYPSDFTNFMSIHKGEAKFMDSLHTNAGFAGQFFPYADVDFYANGGTFQPGCAVLDLKCDHELSATYYAMTINSPTIYKARPCFFPTAYFLSECIGTEGGPTQYFGEYVNHSARGTYFFKTGAQTPFALPIKL